MFLGFPSVLYLFVCAGQLKLKTLSIDINSFRNETGDTNYFAVKRENQSGNYHHLCHLQSTHYGLDMCDLHILPLILSGLQVDL